MPKANEEDPELQKPTLVHLLIYRALQHVHAKYLPRQSRKGGERLQEGGKMSISDAC